MKDITSFLIFIAMLNFQTQGQSTFQKYYCLLYTSDAADERSSVDLGGRRIIKKKKKEIIGTDRRRIKLKNNKKQIINTITASTT